MRLPRFLGKKRGHRRTGSQAWGSLGDGAFHAALLAAGLVFGGLLVSGSAVPEWRVNHDFVPTRGTIVATGLVHRTVTEPPNRRVTTWQPCLRLRYRAGDREVEAWNRPAPAAALPDRKAALDALRGWRLGEEVPAWFDPTDAGVVVLERDYNWSLWLLTLLLPGALVAFGGAGLARAVRRWGKSEERRAVRSTLAGLVEPLAVQPAPAPGHPGVPACDDLINSPGTVLRYCLPTESPESWSLLGIGLFALLWNAILVVLAVGAGLDLLGGRIDWLLVSLLVPFAAVGIGGGVVFVRRLFLATAVGTTQVEISDHPLRPGGRYELLVAQGGSGRFQTLDVQLELEEQATFRQGTDTRTERLAVWRAPVGSWHDLVIAPGTRFEGRAALRIPPTAMHSFATEHNAVRWAIVVRGSAQGWPPLRRVFPLVVFPPASADAPRRPPS